jgi:hypothetical protein
MQVQKLYLANVWKYDISIFHWAENVTEAKVVLLIKNRGNASSGKTFSTFQKEENVLSSSRRPFRDLQKAQKKLLLLLILFHFVSTSLKKKFYLPKSTFS